MNGTGFLVMMIIGGAFIALELIILAIAKWNDAHPTMVKVEALKQGDVILWDYGAHLTVNKLVEHSNHVEVHYTDDDMNPDTKTFTKGALLKVADRRQHWWTPLRLF